MSVYLDTKYLYNIVGRLDGFVKKSENLYNFRCPLCGDSKKQKSKARGYLYTFTKADGLVYKCHNCGASTSFSRLLEKVDPYSYKQYVMELMQEKHEYSDKLKPAKKTDELEDLLIKSIQNKSKEELPDYEDSNLEFLVRLDRLSDNHPCKRYVISRQIPSEYYRKLYYCADFMAYVNRLIPCKFTKPFQEERLIIPYLDTHGRMFAFQGRALDVKNPRRYFTIKLNEDIPRIYGIDTVDYSRPIYVVEGPVDSMFLNKKGAYSCLAVSGSSFECSYIEQLKSNLTIVYDNEPHNKEICRQIGKMIELGYKVCLWESGLDFKDINDAILLGYTPDEIMRIINRNTYQGTMAKIKFNLWKK